MRKTSSRYLLGLLLAIVPAAVTAQTVKESKMLRTRQDTVVTTRIDTMVVTRVDTIAVPVVESRGAETAGFPLDSMIARAVRIGVRQALEEQAKTTQDTLPRTAAERLWDKSQKKRHIERVSRQYLKAVFIPKGQWLVGGTINYQEWDTENINMLVIKNLDLEGHFFNASPYFGYFVANNIALGLRYDYNRNYINLGKFDLNLGEDFNISLEDLYYLSHTHTYTTFVRTYMSLGKSKMFGFYGEVRASYARSTEKNVTGSGVEYDGSFGHTNTLQLTVCPGMSVFVTDFLAAEASIGVMGLKYRWKDQQTNRIETGSSKSGGANFKFNLLSINLGLTFYL